jgi:hypothetical protein
MTNIGKRQERAFHLNLILQIKHHFFVLVRKTSLFIAVLFLAKQVLLLFPQTEKFVATLLQLQFLLGKFFQVDRHRSIIPSSNEIHGDRNQTQTRKYREQKPPDEG